jgi:hypothetical protein
MFFPDNVLQEKKILGAKYYFIKEGKKIEGRIDMVIIH